jgi:hypothetical protein
MPIECKRAWSLKNMWRPIAKVIARARGVHLTCFMLHMPRRACLSCPGVHV